MLQRVKGFFPLFPFFLLSRLGFVQLHWKRSQLCKQVQILAQFLFIYSASYFSNCCQVKTLFNRRQVNMPIPSLCLSHPLCWAGGMMPCWLWPWLPEGWGPAQLGVAAQSDQGTQLMSLRSFGRKSKKLWASGSSSGLAPLRDPYLASWSQDLLILFYSF